MCSVEGDKEARLHGSRDRRRVPTPLVVRLLGHGLMERQPSRERRHRDMVISRLCQSSTRGGTRGAGTGQRRCSWTRRGGGGATTDEVEGGRATEVWWCLASQARRGHNVEQGTGGGSTSWHDDIHGFQRDVNRGGRGTTKQWRWWSMASWRGWPGFWPSWWRAALGGGSVGGVARQDADSVCGLRARPW
jgi:hypothetical protein